MIIKNYSRNLLLIAIPVILLTIFHYITPTHQPLLHGTYRRLYYISIIIAALYFGMRGGIITALVISFLYVPHIYHAWGHIELQTFEAVFELVLYIFVGGFSGYIIDQRNREQYEKKKIIQKLNNIERSSRLGEVAYIITHELKTPVSSIMGAVDILKNEISIPTEKLKFFNIIEKESNRINSLVNQTLASFQQGDLNKRPIRIKDFLNEIKEIFTLINLTHNVNLDFGCSSEISEINIDIDMMKQVFINLINNAVASFDESGKISINCFDDNKSVIFIIKDNGRGIDKDEVKRIFNPFYSVDKNNKGMGLGLAIVKRIIDLHNGSISCYSKINMGTKFTITLPPGWD